MYNIKVIPQDDPTPIPIQQQAVHSMKFFLSAPGDNEGNVKIPIDKQVFQKVLEFLRINNFQEIKVEKVKTNSISQALMGGQKNINFLNSLNGDGNNPMKSFIKKSSELFKAAEYLQCESLQKILGVKVATMIYFGGSSSEKSKYHKK